MYAWKSIACFAVAMFVASTVGAGESGQRIPFAVDSDYQAPPVRANFPVQSAPEIKYIGEIKPFLPQPEPPAQKQENPRPWWAFMRGSRESCIADATKLPTDAGVRIAYGECEKRFPQK